MNDPTREVLVSGKTSFKIEVPYQLIESGPKTDSKPLIVYLHGFGQNVQIFSEKCELFLDLPAYHLFIQAPYPIYDRTRNKKVDQWGRAWYLYDGEQSQFVKSLELASEFIQEVIDQLLNVINVNRLCVVGYSMGGYLAGYFSLTRWKHVNDLIVAGARIKTEILNDNWDHVQHLNVLALHGQEDEQVLPDPQKIEIDKMKANGLNAELKLVDGNHSLGQSYVTEAVDWLKKAGY
jgi:predicted esterase